MTNTNTLSLSTWMVLGCSLAKASCVASAQSPVYIVETHSAVQTDEAVRETSVIKEVPIADGVSGVSIPAQVARSNDVPRGKLFTHPPLTTHDNPAVMSKGCQRNITEAETLAAHGINGRHVTTAVADSGLAQATASEHLQIFVTHKFTSSSRGADAHEHLPRRLYFLMG